jgi:hypothetical protein
MPTLKHSSARDLTQAIVCSSEALAIDKKNLAQILNLHLSDVLCLGSTLILNPEGSAARRGVKIIEAHLAVSNAANQQSCTEWFRQTIHCTSVGQEAGAVTLESLDAVRRLAEDAAEPIHSV